MATASNSSALPDSLRSRGSGRSKRDSGKKPQHRVVEEFRIVKVRVVASCRDNHLRGTRDSLLEDIRDALEDLLASLADYNQRWHPDLAEAPGGGRAARLDHGGGGLGKHMCVVEQQAPQQFPRVIAAGPGMWFGNKTVDELCGVTALLKAQKSLHHGRELFRFG